MAKLALITNLGPEDKWKLANPSYYRSHASVEMLANGNENEISCEKFFRELRRLKLEPNEIALDLLVIACSMYAADTRIGREKFADDSWTREIDLFIPVSAPNIWDGQKERLKEIFGFLTGDLWDIHFRPRTEMPTLIRTARRYKKYRMPYATDTVCLFSGGMDSFIGALDLASAGVRPLLLGHAKSADVSPNQKYCWEALNRQFPQTPIERIYAFLRIPKEGLFGTEEKTERGRSFLFLTLGGLCASCLGSASKLIVPENGVISLNLPLTPLRVGSHSTRTTHPYYLKLMQELFIDLQLNVTIINPYQFKTKGEMLHECASSSLVAATQTMSCSHPASRRGEGTMHCGYCVPCLIRKAAYLKAGLTPTEPYKVNINNALELNTTVKKDNVRAFKYLIEKVRKKPNYLKTLIRSTGPLGNNVDQYLDIYERGIGEVEALISHIAL